MDRIGFRIPTQIAESIGKQLYTASMAAHPGTTTESKRMMTSKRKDKRARPIQRSLTPHFDCCPETFDGTTERRGKWRPIQCFVSLTENMQPSTGGFEAVRGFHREFRAWVKRGRRSIGVTHDDDAPSKRGPRPRPCVGEYTHLDPTLDRDIMERITHIPVRAGSVVFWDNR